LVENAEIVEAPSAARLLVTLLGLLEVALLLVENAEIVQYVAWAYAGMRS
jgi:hypothetical protein